ncbi:putative zinc finger BED domain-containing protein 1-like [Triplophysa rosa]|uniref:Zinc finger BED domain-containing protein 1-like n=1 Tax=Triplophysa rosa TaxID=992332 RepID=A0A9W7WVV7_TRIRA|nr:putative zinc finger BED domain-containing protein 1-like [Triplophysa rosa]
MQYHLRSQHPQASCDDREQTLPSMLSGRKCDARRSEEITKRICSMVVKDILPISVICGEGFQELLGYIEPNYGIPSRFTITRRIEALYEERKKTLKSRLESTKFVALTTDCWTALTTESYIKVTCCYIDDDWQFNSAVLLTQSMPSRHTAENLAAKLIDSVETWGLNGEVSACVHDNARNIVAANSPGRVNWDSVPCFAHTLQLAVNDGFKVFVHRVIVAAGRLVRHFNHSTPACKALEAKQDQMQLPKHQLIQSCKTRWNSVCDMFGRLLEQRWAVTAVLSDRTVTKLQDARTLEIRDEYWQIMTEITPVIVSISNIYPITFSLLNTHLMRAEDDGHRVTEFKAKVRQSLSDRMEVDADELVAKPALIASFLDPQAAKAKLTEMCASLAMATTEDEQAVSDDAAAQAGDEQRSKSNAMLLLLGDNYSAPREITDCPEEVDIYMRDSPLSLDDNPLDLWKSHETRFPRLAILARRYLCIPGTSVPSSLAQLANRPYANIPSCKVM